MKLTCVPATSESDTSQSHTSSHSYFPSLQRSLPEATFSATYRLGRSQATGACTEQDEHDRPGVWQEGWPVESQGGTACV